MGSTTTFQQQFVCLLFFVILFLTESAAFPRSDSSISTYTSLGAYYKPVSLTVPVTQYGVHRAKSILTTLTAH